jgi:hypothetical protein
LYKVERLIKDDKMGRVCVHMENRRNPYRVLAGKTEEKRPLGRPRRRWENNITTERREIEWGGMDWIRLAENRGQWRVLVNTVINLRFP